MGLPSYSQVRNAVLLVTGISGIAFETLSESGERPALLIVFLMLCGFPIVLNVDNLIRKLPTTPPPPLPENSIAPPEEKETP